MIVYWCKKQLFEFHYAQVNTDVADSFTEICMSECGSLPKIYRFTWCFQCENIKKISSSIHIVMYMRWYVVAIGITHKYKMFYSFFFIMYRLNGSRCITDFIVVYIYVKWWRFLMKMSKLAKKSLLVWIKINSSSKYQHYFIFPFDLLLMHTLDLVMRA